MTRTALHHSLTRTNVIASFRIFKGAVNPRPNTPPPTILSSRGQGPRRSAPGEMRKHPPPRRPAGSAGRGRSTALPHQAWRGAGVTGRPRCRKDAPKGGGGGGRSRFVPEPSPPALAACAPRTPVASPGAAGSPASARGSPEPGPSRARAAPGAPLTVTQASPHRPLGSSAGLKQSAGRGGVPWARPAAAAAAAEVSPCSRSPGPSARAAVRPPSFLGRPRSASRHPADRLSQLIPRRPLCSAAERGRRAALK